ncbi:MAG: hypothetical protein ACOYMA_18875 [Bacteroidia bacterium]
MTSKFELAIQEAFEDWKSNGKCSEALKLNKEIGEEYFDVTNPHFFAGGFDSKLVLVHLNPKRNQEKWAAKCNFTNFDEYAEYYRKFGHNNSTLLN